MIRNLMLGMSLVTLSSVSAFAGAPVHHNKAKVVAQAPAAEGAAPAADKPVKKSTKKAAAKKTTKGDTAPGGKMESKGEVAPAPAK